MDSKEIMKSTEIILLTPLPTTFEGNLRTRWHVGQFFQDNRSISGRGGDNSERLQCGAVPRYELWNKGAVAELWFRASVGAIEGYAELLQLRKLEVWRGKRRTEAFQRDIER